MRNSSRYYWSGQLSQYLLLLACAAGVIGLLASRALVATAPLAGVVAVLANPQLTTAWGRYRRLRTPWYLALLYLFWLLSALYTQDWPVWRHELYRQLPLLVVPLAFGMAVPLSSCQRQAVGIGFVFVTALVALGTLWQYGQQYQQATQAFLSGQSLPSVTGIFHIHFSLLLAAAAIFGLLLVRGTALSAGLKAGVGAAALVAAGALHLLAYRTGLLVFYTTLLAEVLALLLTRRRWVLGLLLLATLGLGGLGAYYTLPALQNRVESTHYDLEQFERQHDINDYSLSKRLAAWHTAFAIAAEHPLVGVAPADVRQAMHQQYGRRSFGLRPENQVMVHNQYLHQLVGGGVVGLGLWLMVLFGPLVQPGQWQSAYLYRFLLMQSAAMLADSLLELQISFNFFVFCYGFLAVAAERTFCNNQPVRSSLGDSA